jgi:DNA-binding NarL/FixJ family response regulator
LYDDSTLVSLCLRAGASGYISKDAPMAELVKAMQDLHRGGEFRHSRAA